MMMVAPEVTLNYAFATQPQSHNCAPAKTFYIAKPTPTRSRFRLMTAYLDQFQGLSAQDLIRRNEPWPLVKGNNRYGAKGTIRCLACQRRKGKVFQVLSLVAYFSVNFLLTSLICHANTVKEEDLNAATNYQQNERERKCGCGKLSARQL